LLQILAGHSSNGKRRVLEPERRSLPGNDASWFQALLGDQEDEEALQSTLLTQQTADVDDTETGLPESNVLPQAVVSEELLRGPVSTDDLAETDTNTVAPALPPDDVAPAPPLAAQPPMVTPVEPLDDDLDTAADNTSDTVGRIWRAEDSGGPFDGWEPDEINKKFTSSRTFRWTSLLAALAVVLLIVVGLVVLPMITENRAEARRELYTTTLGQLRSELPDTQTSLAAATDPATGVEALEALGTQLTMLAARASDVDDVAQQDLPSTPPLTSSGPIDNLEPIRQRMEPLGTIATTIQRRIANLAHYRILMAGFLSLPELPTSADSSTQAELRVLLAEAQADSASILSDLPSDVSLDAHHSMARDVNDRFASWQVEYLEALRTNDPDAADALIAELDTLLEDLDSELVTPLAQIRRQTDTELIDLARSIDDVVSLANGISLTP
jgi:hypothetical protein